VVADVWLEFALVHIVLTERPLEAWLAEAGVVGDAVATRGASRAPVIHAIVHVVGAVGTREALGTAALMRVDQVDAHVSLGTVLAVAVVHVALALQPLETRRTLTVVGVGRVGCSIAQATLKAGR
jgi:hypothetical protein